VGSQRDLWGTGRGENGGGGEECSGRGWRVEADALLEHRARKRRPEVAEEETRRGSDELVHRSCTATCTRRLASRVHQFETGRELCREGVQLRIGGIREHKHNPHSLLSGGRGNLLRDRRQIWPRVPPIPPPPHVSAPVMQRNKRPSPRSLLPETRQLQAHSHQCCLCAYFRPHIDCLKSLR